MACSKGWLPGGQSEDSDSDNDEQGTNLPSFIENPIRELIQQQLETFAADKTVSSLASCNHSLQMHLFLFFWGFDAVNACFTPVVAVPLCSIRSL